MFIFFFKQKTAYEMRISDWSSDVCSSDLSARPDVSQRSRFRIAAIFDLTFKSQAAAQSGHSRRTQGDVRRRAESGAVFARFVGMAAKRGKGVGPPFQQVIVEVKADPWRGNEDEIVDLVRLIRIDVAVIFAANIHFRPNNDVARV